jgi:3-(3-hydroxy-phenyl)propionate hydroxylase
MTLANLLGVYGVSTVVVDREPDVIDYPRAVGIDDESLRTCQTFGLVDDVLADTLQDMPIKYFTSWGRCLAHVQPSARPFGWPRRNLFLQPLLERTLREGVTRFAGIDVRLGTELVGLERPFGGPVRATVRDAAGERVIEAPSWLVPTAGAAPFAMRSNALEGHTEPVKWLVDDRRRRARTPCAAVFCTDSPTLMVPLRTGTAG